MKNCIEYLVELGISRSSSKFLLKKFGDEFLKILVENPSRLSSYMSSNCLAKARAIHAKNTYAKEFFTLLSRLDIKNTDVLKAYESLGEDACEIFKRNPYSICDVILFSKVDDYARQQGFDNLAPERIEAAILEVLMNCKYSKEREFAELNGSMYVPQELLFQFVIKLIHESDMDFNSFDMAISKLYSARKIHVSRIENGDIAIYLRELAVIEFETARIIKRKLQKENMEIDNLSTIIERAQAELDILLSDEQSAAVQMALTSPLSVITGGPGTGKTSVQKVLIEAFEWATKCQPVRLIAPTGQAAKRMTESTGYPATTIHKALGLMAGELELPEGTYLDEGLIIVDEASMIDAELFHLLISAISDNSKLVIVGDVNQLPSIGVGAVLRELIKAEKIPFSMLTKVFRQADDSPIAYNAARIKTGEKMFIENESFQFRISDSCDSLASLVTNSYVEAVNEFGIDNVICLTALRRKTDTGVDELNPVLRSLVRKDITANTPYATCGNKKYYSGDKIIYNKNKNGLVNGDLGNVKEVLGGKTVLCEFGDIEVTLKGAEMEALDLAYIQTVHKSQGEEFKSVILVCDSRHSMQNKALIYTGVTRAKQQIICCCSGSRDTFISSISKLNTYRHSMLGTLLSYS